MLPLQLDDDSFTAMAMSFDAQEGGDYSISQARTLIALVRKETERFHKHCTEYLLSCPTSDTERVGEWMGMLPFATQLHSYTYTPSPPLHAHTCIVSKQSTDLLQLHVVYTKHIHCPQEHSRFFVFRADLKPMFEALVLLTQCVQYCKVRVVNKIAEGVPLSVLREKVNGALLYLHTLLLCCHETNISKKKSKR